MGNNVPIGKLIVEINPEFIAITSKNKKLDVCAIWLALKTIDKNKNGTGKFLLSTCLNIIQEMVKCNPNYSYEIFKKGINYFWTQPSGVKGNKVVYLFGVNKVVDLFSFELSKTKPFIIRMQDLFKFDNSNELKTFLSGFVIARYGQTKPITINSLVGNLGLSASTIKRRIKNSEVLTKKKNYFYFDKTFDNLFEAQNYLNKTKLIFKDFSTSLKILLKDSKFHVVKQMGNSYSCEDFSRGKISKRPKAFRKIDSLNRETFKRKKYYVTKVKHLRDKDLVLTKMKSFNNDFYSWRIVNPNEKLIDEINDTVSPSQRAMYWKSEKKWMKKRKECI